MVHLRLLALAAPARVGMMGAVLVGLVLSAVAVTQSLALARLFTQVVEQQPWSNMTGALTVLIVAVLLRPAVVFVRELVVHRVASVIKVALRTRILRAVVLGGPIEAAGTRTAQTQSVLTDGVENLENYYGRYLPHLLVTLLTSTAVVTALIFIDPVVGAVAAAAAISVPLLPRLWDRALAKRGDDHWSAYQDMHADVIDSMRGMVTLKLLSAVARRRVKLQQASALLLRNTLHQLRISLLESGLTALFMVAGPALVLATALWRASTGHLDLALLFTATLLSFEAFRPLRELSHHWHAGYLGVAAGRRITDLLESTEPPVVGAEASATDQHPHWADSSVVFDDVTYRYPGVEAPALQAATFDIAPGESVAIVGPSGAGKSTLVNLLLGLITPAQGSVQLGGVTTAALTPAGCLRLASVVSQDPVLFDGTVRQNLRMCAPLATDVELLHVLARADALELVTPARGGLEAPVGERGRLLSGGQRQRLAIARALLKDAPLMVIDEATSALDVQREGWVLAELLADRRTAGGHPVTTIVVTHRLEPTRLCDRILVVDRSRVVQAGTFAEIVARPGTFHDLWTAQSAEVVA